MLQNILDIYFVEVVTILFLSICLAIMMSQTLFHKAIYIYNWDVFRHAFCDVQEDSGSGSSSQSRLHCSSQSN